MSRMKRGQLELLLDYPQCLKGAATCTRDFCPYHLGSRAPLPCTIKLSENYGEMTPAEIAEYTGYTHGQVKQLLRSALRKLGPQIAPLIGESYDPDKRVCCICLQRFTPSSPTQRSCSGICRAGGRQRSVRLYNDKLRELTAARRSR